MEKGCCKVELGLKRDEVRLVDYTPKWKDEFQNVKKEIIASLHLKEEQVEHIGSTSIHNMPAKPIIDIVVGVDDLAGVDDDVITGLKCIGFLRLRVERPNEIVFARFKDDTYMEKTHYIHLTDYQGELWHNLLFFRNFLNENELARLEYRQLKEAYVSQFSTGIKQYTDYKEKFVKDICAKGKR